MKAAGSQTIYMFGYDWTIVNGSGYWLFILPKKVKTLAERAPKDAHDILRRVCCSLNDFGFTHSV